MSDVLLTVDDAAAALRLHPKTVLRHIREGRIAAEKLGKGWRIPQTALRAFAGLPPSLLRAACALDVPVADAAAAMALDGFLGASVRSRPPGTPPLSLTSVHDPSAGVLRLMLAGAPGDCARLLDLVETWRSNRH